MKKIYKRPQTANVRCQIGSQMLAGSDENLTGKVVDSGNNPVEGGTIEDGGTEDGVAGARGGIDFWD